MEKAKTTGKAGRTILICAFAAVLILNLVLTIRHEMWCDEAQAWLLARDMGPLSIFSKLSYEGHPFLWFYILMPFAKAGVPYSFIKAISFCIITIAVWILLFYSPFSIPARIILAFSPAVLYFYASISRSYCLIAIFTVLAAMLHGRRQEKPLLFGLVGALLLQTHIIMAGMVFFMCLAWLIHVLRRKDGSFRKAFPGLCLPLLSAVFLLWQMRGVAQADAAGGEAAGGLRHMLGTYVWALYYNVFDMMHRQRWLLCIFAIAAVGFFFTAFIAGIRAKQGIFTDVHENEMLAAEAYGKEKTAARKTSDLPDAAINRETLTAAVCEALAVIIGGVAFQNIIYAFVYYANVYRLITWLYMLIYGAWIVMDALICSQKAAVKSTETDGVSDKAVKPTEKDEVSDAAVKTTEARSVSDPAAKKGGRTRRPLTVWLAEACCIVMFACVVTGMHLEYSPQAILDLKGPFTYAQETADFINSLPPDAVILENREDICNSVIPRLKDRTVWSPFGWRTASYA